MVRTDPPGSALRLPRIGSAVLWVAVPAAVIAAQLVVAPAAKASIGRPGLFLVTALDLMGLATLCWWDMWRPWIADRVLLVSLGAPAVAVLLLAIASAAVPTPHALAEVLTDAGAAWLFLMMLAVVIANQRFLRWWARHVLRRRVVPSVPFDGELTRSLDVVLHAMRDLEGSPDDPAKVSLVTASIDAMRALAAPDPGLIALRDDWAAVWERLLAVHPSTGEALPPRMVECRRRGRCYRAAVVAIAVGLYTPRKTALAGSSASRRLGSVRPRRLAGWNGRPTQHAPYYRPTQTGVRRGRDWPHPRPCSRQPIASAIRTSGTAATSSWMARLAPASVSPAATTVGDASCAPDCRGAEATSGTAAARRLVNGALGGGSLHDRLPQWHLAHRVVEPPTVWQLQPIQDGPR